MSFTNCFFSPIFLIILKKPVSTEANMFCALFLAVVLSSVHVDGLIGYNQKHLISRLNFFDTDFLRYSAEDSHGNIMVSPASVKATLGMLLEASHGDTANEIRSALRLSPNKEEFREQLNSFLSALQANTSGVLLENANAVFASKKLKIRKEYEQMLKYVYLSQVCSVDFNDPILAASTINNWTSNATRGLIPEIVEAIHINPLTDIFLTNAIYFKSSWQKAFNPRLTKSSCFYKQNECLNVATMELQSELNYAFVDNLRAHAIELPYEGGKYSMVILIPLDRDGCEAMIRDLPYMSLPQIVDLMEPVDIQLYLPKFSVDYNNDLVSILKNMRITTLFSPAANLSGIFEGSTNPQVNNIFHRTHLEVNEQGTVAAAATGAMVIPLIGRAVHLRVDRPFVFFIKDNLSGAVLFEGKIEKPEISIDIRKEQLPIPILTNHLWSRG